MRSFLILAALLAQATAAAAPLSMPSLGQQLVLAQSSDDDEDDPAPAATTPAPATPADKPAATPAPASTPSATPTSAAPASTTTTTAAPSEQMKLVSGAPLNNPNVAVHTVEMKQFSDSGKREVVLYPIAVQINGKFSQHVGTMGSFLWHLQENFALMVTGGYNWYRDESAFSAEINDKLRVATEAASALLMTWGVLGGVEVTPFYGKFAVFENALARFSVVINGGAGVGGTRVQLKPRTQVGDRISPATYGDTNTLFMAQLGVGFRVQLGERFTIRVEVRDVVYTPSVERINGCDFDDLTRMEQRVGAGGSADQAMTSAACRKLEFVGFSETDPTYPNSRNISLARNLVKNPSSDVINNVGLYLGASFLF